MSAFQRGQVGRMRLHVLPTKQFKTFTISLFVGIPLEESAVTATALAPYVLGRGTARTPETIALRERLDDMYGAGFGFDVYKRGDNQIVQFRMDVINDRFVASDRSLLADAIHYLGELLTEPHMDGDGFANKYTASEKKTVRKRLEALVNDKVRYAAERCIEEMFAGQPYRLHQLGKLDEIDGITSVSLYDHYKSWLDRASFDLYVVGDTTPEQVERLAADAFKLTSGAPATLQLSTRTVSSGQVREIVEEMDVNQGKLNIGLLTNATFRDPEYAALLMYNGILGGYAHSKLFVNVREKASLAYYASSSLDVHKGFMVLQSGIEFANFDKTMAIMREQLENMRQGDISDTEIGLTRSMLGNYLRQLHDSASEMLSFDFSGVVTGMARNPDQLLQEIQAVSVSDIVAVAEAVQLDVIYFLRNRKEG